jgi:hypothetical protein
MLMWMAITAACVSLGAAVVAGAAIVQVGNQAERAESTAAEQCWRSRTLAAFAIEDPADSAAVRPPVGTEDVPADRRIEDAATRRPRRCPGALNAPRRPGWTATPKRGRAQCPRS